MINDIINLYIKNNNYVQRFVTNWFKSTTPKEAQTTDPFWDTSAQMLFGRVF